jgi:hypothetical protein
VEEGLDLNAGRGCPRLSLMFERRFDKNGVSFLLRLGFVR